MHNNQYYNNKDYNLNRFCQTVHTDINEAKSSIDISLKKIIHFDNVFVHLCYNHDRCAMKSIVIDGERVKDSNKIIQLLQIRRTLLVKLDHYISSCIHTILFKHFVLHFLFILISITKRIHVTSKECEEILLASQILLSHKKVDVHLFEDELIFFQTI